MFECAHPAECWVEVIAPSLESDRNRFRKRAQLAGTSTGLKPTMASTGSATTGELITRRHFVYGR